MARGIGDDRVAGLTRLASIRRQVKPEHDPEKVGAGFPTEIMLKK
jgi:hypothetical protein